MTHRTPALRPALPVAVLAAGLAAAFHPGCSGDDGATALVSSRSYRGHENDVDITNFVNAYPATVGTRLDDCQTCHRNATLTDAQSGEVTHLNPCDYCHLIPFPVEGFVEPPPAGYGDTLNPYGSDYEGSGRSQEALGAIAARDSDADGFGNAAEIADLKYPGDPASKPGQQQAPMRTFTLAEVQALASHSQLMLVNSARQQFDFYASYRGAKLVDLLVAAGVDPADPAIQGVTVIAPDGYLQDLPASALLAPFPAAAFYGGLDTSTLGAECGFVQYPAPLPAGVVDGQLIPGELWVLAAYERDALPLEAVTLDVAQGKIDGEGPFRLVVPQSTPGAPDRGSKYSPTSCNDSYDFDENKDHNAGAMVRGAVAIRVNPLPPGTEDFDYHNGGWAFVENATIAVYGHGVTAR